MATTRTPTTPARTRKTTRQSAEIETTTTKTQKKQTGPFGVFMMIVFWILLLIFGPGKILTLTFLIMTFVILNLIARIKGVSFGKVVGNNNWVLWSVLGMFVICMIAAYFNPLIPQAKGSVFLESVKNLFGFQSKVKLHDSVFWSMLNRLFLGKAFSNGWRIASGTYFVWAVVATFVSYTEEMLDLIKRIAVHLGKGESLVSFGIKDWFMEQVWKKKEKK